jgi:hypothetical protein
MKVIQVAELGSRFKKQSLNRGSVGNGVRIHFDELNWNRERFARWSDAFLFS